MPLAQTLPNLGLDTMPTFSRTQPIGMEDAAVLVAAKRMQQRADALLAMLQANGTEAQQMPMSRTTLAPRPPGQGPGDDRVVRARNLRSRHAAPEKGGLSLGRPASASAVPVDDFLRQSLLASRDSLVRPATVDTEATPKQFPRTLRST
jgi:hypothetical protein